MRSPYTQLHAHLVWATWDRLPILHEGIRERVFACFGGECDRLGADLLAAGGVEDHVHLLVRFPTTVSIAELVRRVKGASSHQITQWLPPGSFFKWQGGYGAFTLSRSHLPAARAYVLRQEERHREGRLHPAYELPPPDAAHR